MERIIIEVADSTARQWRDVSPEIKQKIEKNIVGQIEQILQKIKAKNFELLLDKISDQAAKNGLTEEILQQLLNEE